MLHRAIRYSLSLLVAAVILSLPFPILHAVASPDWTTNRQLVAPASGSVSITPNAGSFVQSVWVQLIASTSTAIIITGIAYDPAITGQDFAVSIGTGAAASEVAISEFWARADDGDTSNAYIPVYPLLDNIPASTRVAIRFRKGGTDVTPWLFAVTYIAKPLTGQASTTSAVSSQSTSPTPTLGNSWANGAYVQHSAAVGQDIVFYSITYAHSWNTGDVEIDLATGAGGAEVVKWTGRTYVNQSASCVLCGSPNILSIDPPIKVTSGTRTAVRGRASGTGGVWLIRPIYYLTSGTGITNLITAQVQAWYPPAANSTSAANTTTAWLAGAWVQMIASTASPIALTSWVTRATNNCGGTDDQSELEIGTGGAGSEVVVGTFRWGGATESNGNFRQFPIRPAIDIPTSTRIAIRYRCSGTTSTTELFALGYVPNPDFTQTTSLVYKTAPPAATSVTITPNGSAWANSAYGQLVASTTNSILVNGIAVTVNSSAAPADYEIDLATGAAASETVVTTFRSHLETTAQPNFLRLNPPLSINTGQRVAVRMRKTGTNTAAWYYALNYLDNFVILSSVGSIMNNPLFFCCKPGVR